MARRARVKTEFGVFHIIQRGGSSRKLFESDCDRERFVLILEQSQNKFNYILHGYCLLDSNSYDLIIDVNGGDLSKIMKSINIAYALYAKCNGKLFSDRYKSTLLTDQEELIRLKQVIKNNKLKTTSHPCFNMCFDNVETGLVESLNLDDCDHCIKCIDTAREKLNSIAKDKGIQVNDLIKDKSLRNQLIKSFRKSSTLSLKSLGELFGGLSESSISKILNK